MATREIVALNETTPQLEVPQAGDTYLLPRALSTPAQITSTLATGTAPLVIASTTKVDNLHVARATLGDTVTTNANLTGHVTSTGNAAVLGSFTKAQLNTAVSDGNVQFDGDVMTDYFTYQIIPVVVDGDYILFQDAPFAGTITTSRTISVSGTCTLTVKIGSTALGGTANAVSSTAQEQSHSSSNAFAKGDIVKVTVSANSSCTTLTGTLTYTRVT